MENIQFLGTTPEHVAEIIRRELMPELLENLVKHISNRAQQNQDTEYLTPNELCTMLKIDRSTLTRWAKKDKIPFYRINGKILYNKHEINSIMQSKKSTN